jgi:hypothetical protein
VTGVFGVYSDPDTQVHVYPNGERVPFLGVAFTAEVAEQVGRPDEEVVEVASSPATTCRSPCSHRTVPC